MAASQLVSGPPCAGSSGTLLTQLVVLSRSRQVREILEQVVGEPAIPGDEHLPFGSHGIPLYSHAIAVGGEVMVDVETLVRKRGGKTALNAVVCGSVQPSVLPAASRIAGWPAGRDRHPGFVRQRHGRKRHRLVQDRGDSAPGALARPGGCRVRNLGVGVVVQHRELLGPIGYVPPAEFEENYYRAQAALAVSVAVN